MYTTKAMTVSNVRRLYNVPESYQVSVLTGYSWGTHGVITGYSRECAPAVQHVRVLLGQRTHGYSRGTHGVLKGMCAGCTTCASPIRSAYSRVLKGYSRGTQGNVRRLYNVRESYQVSPCGLSN